MGGGGQEGGRARGDVTPKLGTSSKRPETRGEGRPETAQPGGSRAASGPASGDGGVRVVDWANAARPSTGAPQVTSFLRSRHRFCCPVRRAFRVCSGECGRARMASGPGQPTQGPAQGRESRTCLKFGIAGLRSF